jgi:hypothetical protein
MLRKSECLVGVVVRGPAPTSQAERWGCRGWKGKPAAEAAAEVAVPLRQCRPRPAPAASEPSTVQVIGRPHDHGACALTAAPARAGGGVCLCLDGRWARPEPPRAREARVVTHGIGGPFARSRPTTYGRCGLSSAVAARVCAPAWPPPYLWTPACVSPTRVCICRELTGFARCESPSTGS